MSKHTPAARWREAGDLDPHGSCYDRERSGLPLGDLTDDELANAVFMYGGTQPSIAEVIAGTAKMPIVYLTAGKARIRWLSRNLVKLEQQRDELLAALEEARRAIGEHLAPNDCYATGPMTGDEFRDLVQCPACSAIAEYERVIAKVKGGAA